MSLSLNTINDLINKVMQLKANYLMPIVFHIVYIRCTLSIIDSQALEFFSISPFDNQMKGYKPIVIDF